MNILASAVVFPVESAGRTRPPSGSRKKLKCFVYRFASHDRRCQTQEMLAEDDGGMLYSLARALYVGEIVEVCNAGGLAVWGSACGLLLFRRVTITSSDSSMAGSFSFSGRG
jgi:hypothetical protein